ncbi:MAG: hypothetical protein QG585_330 [Patescibacteria group bacterium]|nr:hypothetical protein [Patescibacteria group bacterium]
MKKTFLYGCGVGLLFVFSFPVFFTVMFLCGSNSWVASTKRLYEIWHPDYLFGKVLALMFVVLIGLIFILIRYIKLKITKKDSFSDYKKLGISKIEKIFRIILISSLGIFIVIIVYTLFGTSKNACAEKIPAPPRPSSLNF